MTMDFETDGLSVSDLERDREIVEQMEASFERAREAAIEQEVYRATHAFAQGFDGMDVHVESTLGWETITWNHTPPSYGPHHKPIRRYDFRGMEFSDLKPDRRGL